MNIGFAIVGVLWEMVLFLPSVKAQTPEPVEITGRHITYQRIIPQAVSGRMPRGAQSSFWGTFTPADGEQTMALHLWNRQRNHFPDARHTTFYADVDFWQSTKKGWVRYSHSESRNQVLNQPSQTVEDTQTFTDANFYWVDANKTVPLVVLYQFFQWDYGPLGTKSYLSFADGWTKPFITQTLTEGGSNTGVERSWVIRNGIGVAVICHNDSVHDRIDTAGIRHSQIEEFQWNGKKFVPSLELEEKLKAQVSKAFPGWRR
ncbi:hypothetical protein IAD21_02367 [Abditibacteriota bacterium]|nr:hypothetical protein IAD21_02367 [Abditibacteriota bacterium]